MNKAILLGLFALLMASAMTTAAETRYISDKIYVPLRVGDSVKHRIVHRGLPSGTRLQLLDSNDDSGYSLVRTDSGIEGWLPSHYLTERPVAAALLDKANARVASLEATNKELREQLKDTSQTSSQTSATAAQLERENAALTEELEEIKRISAAAVKLDTDNRRLLESNQMLSSEVDVLKTDNARLRENKENEFFLNGAFAVLIGVMLTLIIPRLMPKRRSEWG
ncbi:TIGR04211 family SH3 domain-containing protein [Spongiibacter sp. KMU-166]|uniref:TIGR04211 family SH3 domain-containing protein n=1 Tax=Spongiibacter thalassae TaxID=2721624 RepID=A0ABX1GG55_9GAMM|nr:TIGR04211 family SH3 domain-containing protein [Spongiibacter thalassae]